MSKSLYIGVDFDETIVKFHKEEVGEPIEGAIECIKALQAAGHKIILYTMRSNERLVQAVEYLEEEGVKLYAVNENPSQKYWTSSPKIFCNLYIDDAALGCPLDIDYNDKGEPIGRPYVDWVAVERMLHDREIL